MALHLLTLESLRSLDMGKAAEAFNVHLRRAAIDCLDRPGDDKARKVVLEVELKPDPEPDGSCDRVHLQIKASSAVPKHQTRVYSAGLRANGALVFNEDALDNVDQQTFLPSDEERS